MQYEEFRAMNSEILMAAEGEALRVEAGFQRARQWIERSEQRFTRFSEQSELSQLNRSAGSWFKASADLFEVVRQARKYWEWTAGIFDPSILPALKRAGYDRSMDDLKKYGAGPRSHPGIVEKQDFSFVQLDEETQSIYLPEGMQIDLGGIAKGWIAEQAAVRLAMVSNACGVSAGGDMFFVGLPGGETCWQVGLENPLQPDRDIAILCTGPGAIATSSIAKRRWLQGDQAQHHLIDPRTGEPADTDWLCVTVFAPHAAVAEVFAKTLLIGGSRGAGELDLSGKGIDYIAVDFDGRLWGTDPHKVLSGVNDGYIKQ